MKTLKIISVICLSILIGCGEKVNELDQKKETLKGLKQQGVNISSYD